MNKTPRLVSDRHTYPPPRILITDAVDQGRIKNHIPGLVELDVTLARKKIREYRRRTGHKLSLLAWLLKVIADTVSEFPALQAFRRGKRSIEVFKEVDFCVIVEREYRGQSMPLTWMIRSAQDLTLEELEDSLRQSREVPVSGNGVSINETGPSWRNRLLYALPRFIRKWIWKLILSHPKSARDSVGTIHITSVGMMGQVNGWFIQSTIQPLSFGFNAINRKPKVIGNKIEIREILNTTVLFDHDVLDGSPMVRFMSRLFRRVERAEGLD